VVEAIQSVWSKIVKESLTSLKSNAGLRHINYDAPEQCYPFLFTICKNNDRKENPSA
jgi:hypothetical protein